jgi:signal transduction histidine kinase
VAVDADLRVVQLNAAASRLLRVDAAAATGARCRDVLGCQLPAEAPSGPERLRCGEACPFAEVLTTGLAIVAREQTVRARDPEPILVAASYAPTAGGPVGAVAVIRDLRPSLALDQMKSSFVAAVSHELRTPLALISGYAQSLLHLDLDPGTARRHLEQIEDAVGRLTELVDRSLDTSHLERPARHASVVQSTWSRSSGRSSTSSASCRRAADRGGGGERLSADRRRPGAGPPGARQPRGQQRQYAGAAPGRHLRPAPRRPHGRR